EAKPKICVTSLNHLYQRCKRSFEDSRNGCSWYPESGYSENYWTAYKTYRNHITSTLREAKTAYYKAQFESVKHDPKKAWKTVNKILNRKQKCHEINCIHTQNGQISCPNELAERFNNHFTDIGPKIATTIGNTDRNFTDYITKATSSFKFQTVSETKVYKLLSSLNLCKSTGIDKIPDKIIRIAAPIMQIY
ncbi:Hypothetical predicted protein, partial [Paramuricea clavata]